MQTPTMRRRLALLVAAALGLATLAACSSSAAPRTRHTTSSVAAVTASPKPTPAPAASGSPAAVAAPTVARCRTRNLDVTVHELGGAAGSTYYSVVLRNHSSQECRTGGYGGVSLVGGGNGTQVGAPAKRDPSAAPVAVTLSPGQRASARLQVVQALSYPARKCEPVPVDGFRVYPPNETHSAFVAEQLTGCRSDKVDLLDLRPYRPVG